MGLDMPRSKLNLNIVKVPEAERPDREGKKIIAGHFPRGTWEELRNLCTRQDRTSQSMLEEALTDLFAKYRKQ
jgi:hypothetical protein